MKFCIKIEIEKTFELFDNLEKAFNYLKKNPNAVLSLVKSNNTFIDDDGELNYDDKSDTILEELGRII